LFELERQRQQLVAQSESLRNSKDRLDSMTSAVPGVVYQFVQMPQGEWQFSYISGGVEHLYEMTAEAAYMDYKVLTDCMLAEDRQSHRESLERSASNLTPWIHEHRIKTPSGNLKWIRGEATPERQEDGSVVWNGILTDITRQKQLEQKLKTSQERLEMALSGGDIGFWDWHIPSNSVLYSKRWYAMLGLPEGDGTLDLATWTTLIHPDDLVKVNAALASHLEGKAPVYECEHRVRHADGRWLWLFDRGKVVERDNAGAPVRAVGSYIEITDRKRMEEQVRELAFYDTLTNLPNRRLLHDRLSQAMAATKRNGCYGALMFLDLDNFKPLNDSHGHEAGDLLLIEVANRLKGCVREMDTIARIGGDEFVVIISELVADRADSTSQARSVAEKIRTSLSQPYRLTDSREGIVQASYSHQLTASLGVALFISDEVSPEELLNLADRAMYLAKQAGRNSIRFHE
jgi:diguanylate cyclase (GGDEF)-like protein/PAS domain S-box-containing protein